METSIHRGNLGDALIPHFHDEVQVSLVLSGRRRFVAGDRHADVSAGSYCVLPAGVPHRAVTCMPGTVCVNIYVPVDAVSALASLRDAPRDGWSKVGDFAERTPVTRVAAEAGMTREGFSRQFARAHGMPPQAFGRMLRLNRARRLLRVGMGLAEVAATTGFSDQSHLGRWFLHAFGTTPLRYQTG